MACLNFPDCRNTKPIVKEIGVTCPKCDKGQIIERRSNKRNVFLWVRYVSGMRLCILG